MLWFCWSRLAFALILVYLHSEPDWQLFLLTTLCITSITWVAIYQPYKFFYRNAFSILNDVILLYVLSELMCFVHPDQTIQEMRSKAEGMYYVVSVLLILQMFFFLGSSFMVCYEHRNKGMPIHQPIVKPKK